MYVGAAICIAGYRSATTTVRMAVALLSLLSWLEWLSHSYIARLPHSVESGSTMEWCLGSARNSGVQPDAVAGCNRMQ
jgi:hypothetical protein